MFSFFPAVIRLCSGTGVLTELYRSSPIRAFFRFLLLTLLCSLFAACIGVMKEFRIFRDAGLALDQEIGSLTIGTEEISVQKDPIVPRRLKLPFLTLEYFPGNTFQRADFNDERIKNDVGVTILPRGIVVWTSLMWKDEQVYNAAFLPIPLLRSWMGAESEHSEPVPVLRSPWVMYSGAALAEHAKRLFVPDSDAGVEKKSTIDSSDEVPMGAVKETAFTGSELCSYVQNIYGIVVFMVVFWRNFIEIGVLILLISVIQYLHLTTLPKFGSLKYRNILSILFYCTFPAQIAATLLDAAGASRYLSFQILFIGIFFVYQMFAFRTMARFFHPEQDGDDRNGMDDSDF